MKQKLPTLRVRLLDENRNRIATYDIPQFDREKNHILHEMQIFVRESSGIYVRADHYFIGPGAVRVE